MLVCAKFEKKISGHRSSDQWTSKSMFVVCVFDNYSSSIIRHFSHFCLFLSLIQCVTFICQNCPTVWLQGRLDSSTLTKTGRETWTITFMTCSTWGTSPSLCPSCTTTVRPKLSGNKKITKKKKNLLYCQTTQHFIVIWEITHKKMPFQADVDVCICGVA